MSPSLNDLGSTQDPWPEEVDDAAAPIPPLRLDLLQTFVVAAEELSMAEAAKRLYLSPSGMSRRIKALEAEFGNSLFERHTRAMRLTPTGTALLPHARAIVTAARRAVPASTSIPTQRLLPKTTDALSDAADPPLLSPSDSRASETRDVRLKPPAD